MNALRIWTDGVCTDSRGFGGWAYVRLWAGEARVWPVASARRRRRAWS
uniref:Uncharacterized protein n=1 Tax=Phenylobacterium glaciei TaxID=2803784 RepID=A0A974P3X2_9CAUL|nr:hypothetical protein JKL49_00375 [Phenylobacterium glaciei]